jgi:N-acetylmuramic acid 6-phosphate etherase
MTLEDSLITEALNPRSHALDRLSALEIAALMNAEDAQVPQAVASALPAIAQAIDWAAGALTSGGRLIYLGAGTSGRLGVLDASECPPTFGTHPAQVVGLIAGGIPALTQAVEGAEDSPDQGASEIAGLNVCSQDVLVGIAASGRTPYVLGGVRQARSLGAKTIALTCQKPSLLGELAHLEIAVPVGPEILAGSTRLKAGTATKMVLNMISTGAMVRIGKTLGNRMVDLRPLNHKIHLRSKRILREVAGLDDASAARLLEACGGELKRALVAALTSADPAQAGRLLDEAGGQVRDAVAQACSRRQP